MECKANAFFSRFPSKFRGFKDSLLIFFAIVFLYVVNYTQFFIFPRWGIMPVFLYRKYTVLFFCISQALFYLSC